MNCRYFICRKHNKYTDAGYRWAYWQLENKGVVSLGQTVDVTTILKQHDYWNPPDDHSDIPKILLTVREFLEDHRLEQIEYVDEDMLVKSWELGYEWREIKPSKKDEPSIGH